MERVGQWDSSEDDRLIENVKKYTNPDNGKIDWQIVVAKCGVNRNPRVIRYRWIEHLRDNGISYEPFTEEETKKILDLHLVLGNKWTQIAKEIPGRSATKIRHFVEYKNKQELLASYSSKTAYDPQTIQSTENPQGALTESEVAQGIEYANELPGRTARKICNFMKPDQKNSQFDSSSSSSSTTCLLDGDENYCLYSIFNDKPPSPLDNNSETSPIQQNANLRDFILTRSSASIHESLTESDVEQEVKFAKKALNLPPCENKK